VPGAFGFDGVETNAQGVFFGAFAVIPTSTLHGHVQNIVHYEMGTGSGI
jgi:hypothetical protein